MTDSQQAQAIRERLAHAEAIIRTIDGRRRSSGDPNVGWNVERLILDRTLRELEAEIAANPGPLAPFLLPDQRGGARSHRVGNGPGSRS